MTAGNGTGTMAAEKYPKPPFKEQHSIPYPGNESEMNPKPDYG